MKAWAAKTLPTLEHHLQMAESTDAKVKKVTSMGGRRITVICPLYSEYFLPLHSIVLPKADDASTTSQSQVASGTHIACTH